MNNWQIWIVMGSEIMKNASVARILCGDMMACSVGVCHDFFDLINRRIE